MYKGPDLASILHTYCMLDSKQYDVGIMEVMKKVASALLKFMLG